MTITYHAGRRIQGTSSDRTSVSYTQDYSNVISTYSPTFFLKIDEGTGTSLANTGSNTGYTASLGVSNGNPAWVDGVTGYAVSIDGSSGYTAPKISTSDLPTNQNQNYSFTMTMKLTGTLPTSGRTWFWVWGNGALGQYHIGVDWASGSVYYGYYNNGWYYITGTSGDITDGEWHTIGITHSSGQAVKLYIDGSQVGSGTGNDTYISNEQANTIKSSTSGVTLIVDSVFFKNTVLTDNDMQGIHNNLLTENLILGNNVQSGSRFEETDTRKIYYGATPSVTYETDFSSSTGWTTTDSNDVNITNNRLEFNTPLSSTVDEIYYDLGANITSTSAWVFRAKVDFTTVTASGGYGSNFFFGLTSSTSTSNTDFVGIRYRVQSSPSNNAWFITGVNGYPTDSTETSIVNPAVKTYYLEMKRTSSSNVTLTLYNNSDYTGVYQSTVTLTDAGSLGDLRYINVHVVGHPSASSDIIGSIDDIKFYNGVTSTDFTWTEEA